MQFITQSQRRLFQRFYDEHVCIRCIIRLYRITDIDYYRDKTRYHNFLVEIGEHLGSNELLIKDYDFLNIIKKRTGQQMQQVEYQQKYKVPAKMRDLKVNNAFWTINPGENNCILCLGILQFVDNPEFIEKLAESIIQQNYDFEQFKFMVKVPIGINIRIIEELKEELKDDEFLNGFMVQGVILDLKVCVKWIMCTLLSEKIQKRSDANDDRFVINLNFENMMDDIHLFSMFRDTILKNESSRWEETIRKKVKTNNEQFRQEQLQNLERKKNNKLLDSSDFLPSQNNLDKINKLDLQYVLKNIINGNKVEVAQSPTFIGIHTLHSNIYIKGYYIKLARFISQTPWIIDGKKLYETSIQDLISDPFLEIFKPTEVKFHSGGREDIDVRMLGDGRPFMIELVDPHKNQEFQTEKILQELALKVNLNTQVNVRCLQFTDTSCFQELKDSEINKVKAYSCIVKSEKVLDKEKISETNKIVNLKVQQKTPIRVLHRRSLLVREKIIHALYLKQINDHYLIANVLSSAGTYIKEFIHGDLERTKPSLGFLLGAECDIFQLDVIKLYPQFDEQVLEDFMKLCS